MLFTKLGLSCDSPGFIISSFMIHITILVLPNSGCAPLHIQILTLKKSIFIALKPCLFHLTDLFLNHLCSDRFFVEFCFIKNNTPPIFSDVRNKNRSRLSISANAGFGKSNASPTSSERLPTLFCSVVCLHS